MRAKVFVLAGIGVWVAALTLTAAAARDDDHKRGDDDSRVQEGLEMAPVHLDLHGKDRALVGLGSYLVNAVGDSASDDYASEQHCNAK